ncbi:MAG: CDP-glycerol glycerophosphotransferase (TagB/SpsB family) [Glaciecola sp.]|jgi:CDP-glycerol glycerophosphotransferase (TagB/SpsB family)
MQTVHFDLPHLYYLPQFMPVVQVLRNSGAELSVTLYADSDALNITKESVANEGLSYVIVDDEKQALEHYRSSKPDWIVFGNAPCISYAMLKKDGIKLAFMQHGIGPKSCYYTASEFPFDVRFVEGETRKERLQEMFPDGTFVDVGYAKLDPLFNDAEDTISLKSLGLDPKKKTLLYAPTFYPSSIECFSKDWPAELANYNLIIKPHFFSLTKSKYAKQKKDSRKLVEV